MKQLYRLLMIVGLAYLFTSCEKDPEITQSALSVRIDYIMNNSGSSVFCAGMVDDGMGIYVAERGFCYGTSILPTIANSYISCGEDAGYFTGNITGLNASSVYYVRAYAKKKDGSVWYGSNASFITLNGLATVQTLSATDVAPTSAILHGHVTNDGGFLVTSRGFCWSTSQNPTVNNAHITCSSGTGIFTASVAGLNNKTKYYVRAFATNSSGTVYGDNISFTTLQ